MTRTVRAAVLAGLVGFLFVAGSGWLLGFPTVPALLAGAVGALLAPGLVIAAAVRAGTFDEADAPGCPTVTLSIGGRDAATRDPLTDADVEDARGW